MRIDEVTNEAGAHKRRNRVGRGPGSGNGKTSGRGHKGSHSRSGWKRRYYFEGGQMPLVRRVRKRGFTNAPFKTRYDVVNVSVLEEVFEAGDTVDLAALEARGVIKSRHGRLKVLGTGELTKKLTVRAEKVSESARKKVEDAGGTVSAPEKKKSSGDA